MSKIIFSRHSPSFFDLITGITNIVDPKSPSHKKISIQHSTPTYFFSFLFLIAYISYTQFRTYDEACISFQVSIEIYFYFWVRLFRFTKWMRFCYLLAFQWIKLTQNKINKPQNELQSISHTLANIIVCYNASLFLENTLFIR